VREREDITQSIYIGSLLSRATSSPKKTTGIPLRINQQIIITQHYKEVILIPQEHTHSLPFHTTTVKTTSRGTDYTWCTRNHRAPKALLESLAQP